MMADLSLRYANSRSAARPAISARQISALLIVATRLDKILKANDQSLKISVHGWNVVFGAQTKRDGLPVLTFDKYRECLKAIKHCRLYSFASPFFKGTMRISGSVDRLVDVLYSIKVQSDVPQSLEEKVSLFVFKTLKEWIPCLTKRFESAFHYSLDVEHYNLCLYP